MCGGRCPLAPLRRRRKRPGRASPSRPRMHAHPGRWNREPALRRANDARSERPQPSPRRSARKTHCNGRRQPEHLRRRPQRPTARLPRRRARRARAHAQQRPGLHLQACTILLQPRGQVPAEARHRPGANLWWQPGTPLAAPPAVAIPYTRSFSTFCFAHSIASFGHSSQKVALIMMTVGTAGTGLLPARPGSARAVFEVQTNRRVGSCMRFKVSTVTITLACQMANPH